MPRTSPVHYIAPSAISIVPNANGSENDLAVYVARGVRIKVYSPKAGIDTENASYKEWSLSGRNRRLADSGSPYTIYARLSQLDRSFGYLVFAPKIRVGKRWLDKYPYVTISGIATGTAGGDTAGNWYVRLGDVSLPDDGRRTVTLDTGILGTDQFNAEWNLDPDDMPLRVVLSCTVDGVDAGPTPYVLWGQTAVLTAGLVEGWDTEAQGGIDHWTIDRKTENGSPDQTWPDSAREASFGRSGTISLPHIRNGQDDFLEAVSTVFTVTAWGLSEEDGAVVPVAQASITIMPETVETYRLALSEAVVSYNPVTGEYRPSDGITVGVRGTSQKGEVFRMTRQQAATARLSVSYCVGGGRWMDLPFSSDGEDELAVAVVPVTVFQMHKGADVRLTNGEGRELDRIPVAFVQGGTDTADREWIFLRSRSSIAFGDARSPHPLPSLVVGGEVSPEGAASGSDTDKDQDGWVPMGWWDEMQGTDEEYRYEYASFRDSSEGDDGRQHWGAFSVPTVWGRYSADYTSYRCRWELDGQEVWMLHRGIDGQFRGRLPLTATLMRHSGGDPEEPAAGETVITLRFEGDGYEMTQEATSPRLVVSEGETPGAVPHLSSDGLTGLSVTFAVGGETFMFSIPTTVQVDGDEMKGYYLSKAQDDEAYGTIGFLKGVWFGARDWFVDALGNAALNFLTLCNLKVTGIVEAIKGYFDVLKSNNFSSGLLDGTGWRITTDNVGDGSGGSEMEIDFLKVRKKATFMELEVRKETFVGGNQNYSPAGSIIYRVDYMDADGNAVNWTELNVPFLLKDIAFLGDVYNYAARKMVLHKMQDGDWVQVHHFRCYLLADDGSTATRNWWRAGDQVRSQTFNRALSSKDKQSHTYDAGGQPMEDPSTPMPERNPNPSKPVETSYYWRLCTNTGSEKLEDGKVYDYIDLPFEGWYGYTSADIRSFCDAGSGIPVAGDHIVCMGNRNDQERMNMISLCTTGTDNNPPSLKGYRGIHTFNIMPANKVFDISPDEILFRSNRFKFLIDDGNILPPVIDRGEWGYYQRYHYYDRVSWNGSMWLCLAADDYVWQDASGNGYADYDVTDVVVGEGEFAYTFDGEPRGNDHYYKTGRVGGKTVYYIRFYTYLEPADGTDIWMKQVAKGTEITDSDIMYAASLDGVNHPSDDDTEQEDAEVPDTSGITVPDHIKQKVDEMLTIFASQVTVGKTTKTYDYLTRVVHEAYVQFNGGDSPYGLPKLYTKSNFPTLTDYYGTHSDTTKAFDAMAGFCVGTVLTELYPSKRNILMQTAYNIGPRKDTFIYYYRFESDHNIARLVGSVVCAAMRGRLRPDMTTMRTEIGGSLLNISIESASVSYASHKDDYYVDLQDFMPSAPGPYYPGYTDRSQPGIPYDAYDLEDHNLQKDLDIYNLVVSDYNLNGSHHQEVVQAIADKDADAHHLFGKVREAEGYTIYPVFGEQSIGRHVSDSGATAGVIGYIFDVGIASRQALKQGTWDGRYRPGQKTGTTTSKDAPYGILYNYTIDNIDGNPVKDYDEEGYITNETHSVSANSYPSGHSSGIWATALYLIELMPSRAADIMKRANQFCVNRQICRYHWNSDTIIGRLAGATIAPVMRASSDYATMLVASRNELSSGLWKDNIEDTGIQMGQYLWTRTRTYYSDNRTPTVVYSVSRWGIDGDGISEINSYYYAQKDEIEDMADYDKTHTLTWYDTFADCSEASGGVGNMQGWFVWEKTVITYDARSKETGEPVTKPDVITYKCSRIGQDGQIGMEEYYMLAASDDFNTVFGSAAPSYAKVGIRWYNQTNPSAERWRLSNTKPNINTGMWSPQMPTYDKATHGDRKFLWNFEQSVDGQGTEYATRPICIGNHARSIKGVIELYALSSSQTIVSEAVPFPQDIKNEMDRQGVPVGTIPPGTCDFSKKNMWADEKYERAPQEKPTLLPYQWNWTRTLYSATENGKDYEDHYHVSSVLGTAGEDGSGTEYIYKVTNSATPPATPTNPTDRTKDDYIPTGWNDNPQGVSYGNQYEWVSERTSSSSPTAGGFSSGHVWGDFSTPRLWSKWGKNGQDGDGVEYVFTRTTTNVAPSIVNSADSRTDSAGRTFLDDEYLPLAKGGSITSNTECTDGPTGVSKDYPFEWVSKRTKADPNAETGVRQWEKYSGAMSLWATFSSNSVRIDLDNEMDAVSLDSDGKVRFDRTVVVKARVYDGSKVVTSGVTKADSLTAANMKIGDRTPKVSSVSSGVVTITWAFVKGDTVSATTKTIELVYESVTYSAVFSLTSTKLSAIYQVMPSPSAVSFSLKSDNTLTPDSITLYIGYSKDTGSSTTTVQQPESRGIGEGLYLYYRRKASSGTWGSWTNYPAAGITVSSSTTYTDYEACIASVSSASSVTDANIIDREVIPVVKDGKNGSNGSNAVRVDLDNENDSMLYTGGGTLVSGNVTSTGYLYDGIKDVSSSATWSIKSQTGCTATISSRTVTVTAMSATSGSVVVQAVYQGQTYTATLTLKKIVDGDKYDLVITPNSIAYNVTTDTPATSTLAIKVWKTSVNSSGGATRALSAPPTGYEVYAGKTEITASDTGTYSYTTDNSAITEVIIKIAKSGTSTDILDSETVPVTKAENGFSVVRLDISNEMDMIPTTAALRIDTARTVETTVRLFDGATEVNISSATISTSGGPASTIATASQSADGKGRKLSWAFKAGQTMAAAYEISLSYTYKSVAYTAVFTVSASKGEAVWQLKPSLSAIPFQRNADNTLTPASSAIGLSLLKIDGGSTATYTSVQAGLTVRYSTSSMPSSATKGTGWESGNITVANTAENLYIAMFNASGVLLDRETVPVVKDGENGFSVVRLDISNEMDMIPTTAALRIDTARTVETTVRLFDGATEVDISSATISTSGGPDSTIATASKSADGKGRKLSWAFIAGKTMAEAYEITVSYTYKSVAYTAVFTVSASKGEAVWQLKPSLSAIPFQRNADNTLTPASRAVGLSLLKIDGGSTATYTSVQTGLTVRYSTSSMPSSATKGTGWESGNITVANTAENLYIAMFNASGVLLDRETVPVVKDGEKGAKGDKGPQGPQGSYKEVQYARGDSFSDHSDSHIDGGSSGWKSTPPMPSVYYPIIWQRERTVNPSTGSQDSWSYFPMTGQKGDPGSQGKTGLWYRYAGVWGVDVSPNVGVTNTDTVGYYVKYESGFYMNIKESGANKTTPSISSEVWELMNSAFQYFISKAVFADTAYLGSFIINGDWLISQHGILYGNTGVGHPIDDQNSYGGYNVTNAYTAFDPAYPNSSKPSAYNFCPNVAIDGKTGAAYLNDLHAKGELNVGDEGTNRLEIAGNRKNGSIVESYIDGYNKSGNRILRLGFTTYSSGNASDAYLNLRNLSGKNQAYVYPSNINIENTVGSNTSVLTVGWLNDKIMISAPLSCWPTRDQVGVGEVFLGDDEILRVRRS